MTRLLDSLGLWFTDYYLLSAVLLLLALIAIRLTRQPIHRLTIIKATLVALGLLAGLCALPGWSIVHLITTEREDSPPVSQVAVPTTDSAALKHFILLSDGNESTEQPRANPSMDVPVQTKSATWNVSWRATLAASQIAGALIVMAWLVCGFVAAHRLRLSSTAVPSDLLKLLEHLSPPTPVDLRTSDHINVPVALGILRPAILLPLPDREGLGEGSIALGEHLRPILAHELAHIRNHDLHWLAVSRALMILLWSQPLYWLMRRRMRLDQESLADASAADVSSREQYAEQLVSWARNLGSRPTMRIASAVGLWEGPSQLRQRIVLLLDDRFIILRHFSRKLQLAAIALCALTATALSLVTLEPAQSQPQEKPAPIAAKPQPKAKEAGAAKTANTVTTADETPRPEFKPNTITGRAVDDKGAPVSGVEVFLFWIQQSNSERQPIAQTKTDDQGNYRFDNVIDIDKEFPNKKFPPMHDIGDRLLQGVIRAPGRVSTWWLEVPQMVAQRGAWHQWPMPAAATLEGHVTGPDGKPVAGAMVAVNNGSVGSWDGASSTRTNADGYYKINDAPPFDLEDYNKKMAEQEKQMRAFSGSGNQSYAMFVMRPTITVKHPDFAELHTKVDQAPGMKELQLELPAILEGRVVFPDGKAAAGAIVSAATSYQVGATVPRATSVPVFYKATAVADDTGRYRITSFPSGKYDIWANVPDWVNVGATAVAAASGKSNAVPDLAMTKGAIVRARVVDEETRQPIVLTPDARVLLLVESAPPRSAGRAEPSHYVAANAEGRFERRATPGKKIVVIGGVEMDGEQKWYGKEHVEVQLPEGESLDVDVPATKVVPEPTGRIAEVGATQITTHQNPKEALKTLDDQLKKNPGDIQARFNRVEVYNRLGDDAKAAADLEHLLKLKMETPTRAVVLNNLAFVLATSPDDKLRDGNRAVELAEQAKQLQHKLTPDVLDTLAAACAETGDFECAIRTQKEAIDRAPEDRREEFRQTLKLYEAHKPRRQTSKQVQSASAKDEGASTRPVKTTDEN